MLIKTFETLEELREGAKTIISRRLYVNGYWMREVLGDFFEFGYSRYIYKIAIVYHEDVPIACAVVDSQSCGMYYVRKPWRRKGIATDLCKLLKVKYNHGVGIKGSEKFFESLGQRCL